jgi:hypothetical protein
MNNHNSQLTLHTDSHASDSGALRRSSNIRDLFQQFDGL